MTIPNILTFVRLLLIIPAVIFALNEMYIWALVIFTLACITDLLDGYIARRFNMVSEIGMMLDPLADKLMAMAMVVIICLKGILPMFVLYIVVAKELIMIIGGMILVKRGVPSPANIIGKMAALIYNVAIMLAFLYQYVAPFHEIVMYVALGMLVIAFIQYGYINGYKKIIKHEGEKKEG